MAHLHPNENLFLLKKRVFSVLPQLLCGSGRSQMFPDCFVRGLRRERRYKARGLRRERRYKAGGLRQGTE